MNKELEKLFTVFKEAYKKSLLICDPIEFSSRKDKLLTAMGDYLKTRVEIEEMDKQINKVKSKEKKASAQLKSAIVSTNKLLKMDKAYDKKLKKKGIKGD